MLYILGRSQAILMAEVGSLIGILSALLLIIGFDSLLQWAEGLRQRRAAHQDCA